jgi:ribosomal protein S18 acetylase RimI-like enzyme
MHEKTKIFYLEINNYDTILYKYGYEEKMVIREVENDAYLNFMFFAGVGLSWRWYSRLGWSYKEWDEYFNRETIKTFLGFNGKSLCGFYELCFTEKENAEIKFIGMFPGFMGRGLGGALLSHAIKSSFDNGAKRIWLHTCTNDSDHALENYLARGFRVFKEEEIYENIPEKDQLIKMISLFFKSYDEHCSDILGQ